MGDKKIQGGARVREHFLDLGIVLKTFWNETATLTTLVAMGGGAGRGCLKSPACSSSPHGPLAR
ncbi:hypothetical protein THIX_70175 [Thiomonas sp. X19]|nr:hypothetical protein THIX_70175 [Thiomonas sp. X19]